MGAWTPLSLRVPPLGKGDSTFQEWDWGTGSKRHGPFSEEELGLAGSGLAWLEPRTLWEDLTPVGCLLRSPVWLPGPRFGRQDGAMVPGRTWA